MYFNYFNIFRAVIALYLSQVITVELLRFKCWKFGVVRDLGF